jgi:hypothetical protein
MFRLGPWPKDLDVVEVEPGVAVWSEFLVVVMVGPVVAVAVVV